MTLLWRLRIAAAVLVLPPLLRLVPLDRLAIHLGRRARVKSPGRLEQEAIVAGVDRFLDPLPSPWAKTCLTRSVVLYHLFRRSGIPVELCIGVKRDGSAMAAHAWLERDGERYVEARGAGEFELIARFPSAETV